MSNSMRPPSVGPIVGHTTSTSVRLWIRGPDVGEQRTIGVAALFDGNRPKKTSARYFRLHREYDRTGWIDFGDLQPDTKYRLKLGSISVDSVDAGVNVSDDAIFTRLPKPDVWCDDLRGLPDDESEVVFTTFPEGFDDQLSFVFGSCRYPGLFWQAKRADSIFGTIQKRFDPDELANRNGPLPKFLMMVGDQIYADLLNSAVPFRRADTSGEFHERYVSAFTSPNIRRLMRQVPNYMMLDDHEIEDNWVQGRIKDSSKRMLFNLAITAYMSYQWLHCPRNYKKFLYYSFDCAGYPFFVLDERTQRIRDDDDYILEDNHLLGVPSLGKDEYKGQLDYLCDWLKEKQATVRDRPKFIVSPSVFVPNEVTTLKGKRQKCESDSWAAFPETRKHLLRTIVEHNVQNVVFLSGDIHCSNVAEISFHEVGGVGRRLDLKAFSITSSAFYWPFPFADGNPLDFVHDSEREQDDFYFDLNGAMFLMRYKASKFEQDDNFTQVTVVGKQLQTQTFDRYGELLQTAELTLA